MIPSWVAVASALAGVFIGGVISILNEWLKWRRDYRTRDDRLRIGTYASFLAHGLELLGGGTGNHLRANLPEDYTATQRKTRLSLEASLDFEQTRRAMNNELQVVYLLSTEPVIREAGNFFDAVTKPHDAQEQGKSEDEIHRLTVLAANSLVRLQELIRVERGVK